MNICGAVLVPGVGSRLADDVLSEGEAIGRSLRNARLVGDDGLHNRALGVTHTVDHDAVLVVVDDGELDALEVRPALRRGAGLGVELGDLHATAFDLLGELGRVVGALNRGIARLLHLLNRDEIGVEVVALGSLGLADNKRATRNDNGTGTIAIQRITRYIVSIGIRKVNETIFVGCENPCTRRKTRRLGFLFGIEETRVMTHGELSPRKRCGTLRQVTRSRVGLLPVVLADEDAGGVVQRCLVDNAAVDGHSCAWAHVDRIHSRIERIALGGFDLLDVVRANAKLIGRRIARSVGHEGIDLVCTSRIRVDTVFGTVHAVKVATVRA